MNETLILVPVSYPVKEQSVSTLQRAIELADEQGATTLSILHINIIHKNENVTQESLVRAVEHEVGPLANATYDVRDAFLLEEAVLYEAVQQKADYVVIGKDTRAWWRRILSHRLGIAVDLEMFLQNHLNATLVVV